MAFKPLDPLVAKSSEARPHQIPAAIDNLEDHINGLASNLTALEDRLVSVLHITDPDEPKLGPAREPGDTPLAGTINNYADRVEMMRNRVNRILCRLEL